MNKWKTVSLFLISLITIISCSKTEAIRQNPQPYWLQVPANFPQPVGDTFNPLTKEGIELGRQLFYDKRLSANNQISCSSCHHQELSFSDGVALNNVGVSTTILHRNAPALINMAWANNGLFWDGGATNLESQAFAPITAHDEMAQNLYELITELKAVPKYVQQFLFVFKEEINPALIVKALAQFQRTFVSANSRYDKYVRNESGGILTAQEMHGLNLVRQKCQGCHKDDLFTDNLYHNNGLDDDFSNDNFEGIYKGRFRITNNLADLGKFKTPTLRNLMLTAPYMHDGRMETIEQVIQHYITGVKNTVTTDSLVKQNTGAAPGIPITTAEKNNIIAFLKTLTDSSFINNPKLSEP